MGDEQTFAAYLRGQLDRHQWSAADLNRQSGLSQSLISRWLRGETAPGVDNARILASAFRRPLLEVLVAAGILTDKEARQKVTTARADALSDDELVAEVRRRMAERDIDKPPASKDAGPEWSTGRPKRTGGRNGLHGVSG